MYTDRVVVIERWVARWVRRPAVAVKQSRAVEVAAKAIIRPRDDAPDRREVSVGSVAIEAIGIGSIVVIEAIEVVVAIVAIVMTAAIGETGIEVIEAIEMVIVIDVIEGRSYAYDVYN